MILIKSLYFGIHGNNLTRMLDNGLKEFGLVHGEKRVEQAGVRTYAHMSGKKALKILIWLQSTSEEY